MRIIRGLTPFKPTKFSGCALWLAADRGVTTVDGKVSSWADQSGNGNHATQGTVASRPTYVASAQGGRPTLRFDGSNDFLSMTPPLVGVTDFTIFSAFKANDSAVWITGGGSDSTTKYYYFGGVNSGKFCCSSGSLSGMARTSQNYDTTNYHILVSKYDHVTNTIYLHGVKGDSIPKTDLNLDASTSPSPLTGKWGVGMAFAGYYGSGDISEIIIFNRALTDAERVKVEQYLSGKYAITLS